MNDLKYWIALSHFLKFGPAKFKKLKEYFPTPENAFKASVNELTQAGIEIKVAEEFISARVNINPELLLEQLEKENIKVIIINDKSYPKLLSEIYHPPPLLYYKGLFKTEDELALAVVGARKHTNYGKQVTEQIVKDLARSNLTIVSGMALGIDTIAHLATIESGGRTIAVLGSGLDKQNIYPSSNRYLVDKIIASGGAVVSEFPIGTPPLKHHFPMRNRLISGLSLGTLIIEAGEKSGALITANCALEQNREVFAVPGNIYSPVSIGPNKLIKLGAKTITNIHDIIETLDLTRVNAYIDNKKIIPESSEEKKILSYLTHEPIHINKLVHKTQLDTAVINSTLTIMEIKGIVKNTGNMEYVLVR